MNILQDVNLAKYTTFKIGGDAKYFVKVNDLKELRMAITFAEDRAIEYFVLGGGSNLLVSDQGYQGLVIKLDGEFKTVYINKAEQVMEAGAGMMLPQCVRECIKYNIAGFEFFGVIPGTVGAAVRINAGTKLGSIADHLLYCDILSNGEIIRLNHEDLQFGYRSSAIIGGNAIILKAYFKYENFKEKNLLVQEVKEYRVERKSRQPKNRKCCGSVFKSHIDRPAGFFIEQCDLKGTQIGGAMISKEHANWIVNQDYASAQDVLDLIDLMQTEVKQKFNIDLELEMEYLD
jgi:UDP-N-acetylmuramate dehydrogenase